MCIASFIPMPAESCGDAVGRTHLRWLLVFVGFVAALAASCLQGQKATDTGDPGFPFGPSAIGVQPLAYQQDVKPIFDRDCLSCHGARRAAGNYSVETYTATIAGQRPGDASSSVVVDCSPGGSMYGYFSGDAVTDATIVFRWMVYYNAQQSR
jgi:hypothetical protein